MSKQATPRPIHIKIGDHVLTISMYNKKMGRIASISVSPIKTCKRNLPCYKLCYAVRMERGQHGASIAKSWARNAATIAALDPELLADRVSQALRRHGVKVLRFNVSGDFALKNYWKFANTLAELNPETRFYAFTKLFALTKFKRANNFSLVLSAWNDYKPCDEIAEKYPVAYYNDGTSAIPAGAHTCAGDCEHCMRCAFAIGGESIAIAAH